MFLFGALDDVGVSDEIMTATRLSSIEGARARDQLRCFIAHCSNAEQLIEDLTRTACIFLHHFTVSLPPAARFPVSRYGSAPSSTAFGVSILDVLPDPANAITNWITPFYLPRFTRTPIFQDHRIKFERNLCSMSGLPYPSPATDKLVYPTEFKGHRRALVDGYLKNTWLLPICDMNVPIDLSIHKKHHWAIYGRTGHGKTQLLQALVLDHLREPDPPPLIIIDTQSNLQRDAGFLANIERLAMFDDRLRDRLVVVDPRAADVPALNMFDVPNLSDEAEIEVVDLYSYVFRALAQELTGLQDTNFSFVARLMIAHDGATLTSLLTLMNEQVRTPTESAFWPTIEGLDPITRQFFETRFFSTDNAPTRRQIANRLFGVLRSRAFERMFNAPTNTLDLFDAIQKRKIVLIAPGGLGDAATNVFARYMIALAMRAAFQRDSIPESDRHPALLIIDEAHGLFDQSINTILVQARKFGLFLRFATQHFDQIPDDLRAAIISNSEVVMAGGLSAADCRKLAPDMHATPDILLATRRTDQYTEFATYIQNATPSAIKVSVPFGLLEAEPRSDDNTYAARKRAVRAMLSSPREPPAATAPAPHPRAAPATSEAPVSQGSSTDAEEFKEPY